MLKRFKSLAECLGDDQFIVCKTCRRYLKRKTKSIYYIYPLFALLKSTACGRDRTEDARRVPDTLRQFTNSNISISYL